ncbi:uncharacterized protein LOC136034849 isoform X2 [Artemia franciscana]|uniref:Ras-associating domain-containing protein n=2 Tax=Artemia franciscana TaxID=6661 RepID=A0AA88LD74_ARTSF|nr:hypothetical protein QYM36_002506 [Artemia franciscana]
MLKHAHLSPSQRNSLSSGSSVAGSLRSKSGAGSDTLSITSFSSILTQDRISSRASSFVSLDQPLQTSSPQPVLQTTIVRVHARCLRPDIEYKTVSITHQTTCREVVQLLLNKVRMRHRDPKLFYLTMEVGVKKTGVPVRTLLVLDDESRPAVLQSCHPRGNSRFALQMRRGGLVRVHDGALSEGSKYKSLLISERTTVEDVIQLLLNINNSKQNAENFVLNEACNLTSFERPLHLDDCVLAVQATWPESSVYSFVLRRIDDIPSSARLRVTVPWEPSSRHSSSICDDSAGSDYSAESPIPTPSGTPIPLPRTYPKSPYHNYENYFYI